MKRLTLKDFQERLNKTHPQESLKAIFYETREKDAKVQCLTCGKIYIKKGTYFLDKRKISICKNCFPTRPNSLKKSFELPDEYSYVENYKGMHQKILIKHNNCGFIWKVTPNNLKYGKECPKCNKKISKGEQKIIKWLEKRRIRFVPQYKVVLEGHSLFIDFFLPDYNLFIEYNGEQHYKSIKHFGGRSRFKVQLSNDNLKRKYLNNNLLEIPYTQFENLEEILESSTTIQRWSTLQAMAKEAEKLLNKSMI